jgi:heme O synthase-like polyprenyltransferase
MRTGSVLIVLWLLVGGIAAAQRGYYSGPIANCTRIGTILVTAAAGPLNYVGLSPKLDCKVPQPSR